MNGDNSITILGEEIPVREESVPINTLHYNKNNPRVHTILYGNQNNDTATISNEDIYKEMLNQPSVNNYKQDIYENRGLVEPILIRCDTNEVIEGNSRLTVYLYWHNKEPQEETWQTIPCRIVDKLTEAQQDWYLNKIHIEGKTPWAAYEKANLVYKRYEEEVALEDIKKRFNITEREMYKLINTIEMMKDNNDNRLENFSYYDVLERKPVIKENIDLHPQLKELLFEKIKEDEQEFTAMQMRNKLPTILESKKHRKKFLKDENLDEAYESAKTNNPDSKLRAAIKKIKDIKKNEITNLENKDINKLELSLKKLNRECDRIKDMIKKCKK